MSSFVPRATPPTLAEPDPTKHVKYTLGMVLGVDDFTQEFAYLSGRDQWLARDLLGYGTASGLRVVAEAEGGAPQVLVTPGVAVSPRGQLIRVAPAQCADLNSWLMSRREELGKRLGSLPGNAAQLRLHVVLCYRDCATDLVPIPGEPCRAQEETLAPSRLADDFRLELRFDAPGQTEEDALRDFVEWLSQVEVTDEPGSFASVEELEKAIRDAARLSAPAPASPPDFLHGSPPEALRIHPSMAYEYLRSAFRLWATELRPRWRAGRDAGRESLARTGDRGEDDCVLLAELAVPLARAGVFAPWQVEDSGAVEVHEERRPYLVHLRMLQELIVSGRRAGGGATGGGPAIGPAFSVTPETTFGLRPGAGRRFDYARADHTHGTPPPPAAAGDVIGLLGSTTVAAIRNREVDPATPGENQVLTYRGGKWRPADPPAGGGGGGASPQPATTVVPETGVSQVSRVGASLNYAREDHTHGSPPLPTMGGDLSGAANVAKVIALQGVAVDATRPTANQVLAFDQTLGRWKAAAPPQGAPAADAVTRPAGRPAYRIVAAGLVPLAEGGGPNSFSNLRVTRVAGGRVTLNFDGYEPPAQPNPRHQYVVKALPVLGTDAQLVAPAVAFAGFGDAATGFSLLVTNAGQPLEGARLATLSLMIEVSQFDVQAVKDLKEKEKGKESEKAVKESKEAEKAVKESKEAEKAKESKEAEKAKDTKEAEKAVEKAKDTKEKEKAVEKAKEAEKAKDTKEAEKAVEKAKDTKEKEKAKESKEVEKGKDTKEKEKGKDTKEAEKAKDTKEASKEQKEEKEQKDRTKEGMALKEKDRDSELAPANHARSFTLADPGLSADADAPAPDARAFIREEERPAVGRRALELADKSDDKLPESGGAVEKPGEAVN